MAVSLKIQTKATLAETVDCFTWKVYTVNFSIGGILIIIHLGSRWIDFFLLRWRRDWEISLHLPNTENKYYFPVKLWAAVTMVSCTNKIFFVKRFKRNLYIPFSTRIVWNRKSIIDKFSATFPLGNVDFLNFERKE